MCWTPLCVNKHNTILYVLEHRLYVEIVMDIATWNSEHKDTIRQQTNKNKKRYEQLGPHQKPG